MVKSIEVKYWVCIYIYIFNIFQFLLLPTAYAIAASENSVIIPYTLILLIAV